MICSCFGQDVFRYYGRPFELPTYTVTVRCEANLSKYIPYTESLRYKVVYLGICIFVRDTLLNTIGFWCLHISIQSWGVPQVPKTRMGETWSLCGREDAWIAWCFPWWRLGWFQWLPSSEPTYSGWWFQTFFMFIPIFGEDSHVDEYFSNGLVQPPTSYPPVN